MASHDPGKKIASSHSSATDLASKVVKLAQKQPEVTKISLGIIKPNLSPAPQRIKSIPITGGIRLSVRSSTSIQQLHIYTLDPQKTIETLKKKLKIPVKE